MFGVLGRLEVRDATGGLIVVRRRKQRALLALLLIRPGRSIGGDEIIDALWGERPPASARANLHSYVSDLRNLLARAAPRVGPRPATTSGGYRLDLEPGECDALIFDDRAAAGRRALAAGHAGEAAERLARALGLWRGQVLEDVGPYEWLRPYAAGLAEARLSALEDQAEARLALGHHADLAVELMAAVEEHPLRERLWQHYLRALHGAGRRAEAMDAYDRLCELMDEELGVTPGPSLRELIRRIRGDEADPDWPGSAVSAGAKAVVAPALLPPDVADFTGRRTELDRLLGQVAPHRAENPGAALRIAGITGMAGVGKTTLVVHLAHLLAPSYPDGQLYVNLRGAEAYPLDPADVLGRLLRSLGVDSRAVPAEEVERAELYRTMLAGRRVLVVLDNAASERQVRPLLPGARTCAVLLTSRSQLTGVEGARWTRLDVFAAAEATRLLARVVDDGRVGDQEGAAAEIVRLCGGLPLAIRIAGARLTARSGWRLGHLVALLRDERSRLDQLTTGDLEVRASLALSYDGLDLPARRLFRRLGLFDVPDFPAWMAAAVLGDGLDAAARDLETLVDANLIAVAGTDPAGQVRYRFHDLVRLYARDRALGEDDPDALSGAGDRDGDGRRPAGNAGEAGDAREAGEIVRQASGAWLAIAERMAARVPGPCYAAIGGSAVRPAIDWAAGTVLDIDPLTWFDAEYATLQSVVRQACRSGLHEVAFDLAGCMEKYFDMRGMYTDWTSLNRLVMAACREAGNLRGEAVMLRGLIDVTTWITDDPGGDIMNRSYAAALRLLEMFTKLDERRGMSDAEVMCAWASTAVGRLEEAVEAGTRALQRARESGHIGGLARAHVVLAVAQSERRSIDAALAHLGEALAAARELGNARYEATVLQFLGIGHREFGDLQESERLLGESLAISRRYGDTFTEVLTLLALARLYHRQGDPRARPTAVSALADAREYQMSHHIADALGLLGELELAEGRAAEAVGYLEESVAVWRTRGWLSYQAAALTSLGRACSALDRVAAREAFEEALRIFRQLGNAERAGELTGLLATV